MKEIISTVDAVSKFVSQLACSFGSSINHAGDEAGATVEEGPFRATLSTQIKFMPWSTDENFCLSSVL